MDSTIEARHCELYSEERFPKPLPADDVPTYYLDTNVVLTGRKRTGKTRLAKLLPHEPMGFSDPMRRVCEAVLGTSDKSCRDVRDFLHNLGALGRGEPLPCELRNSVDWDALRRRLRRDGGNVTGLRYEGLWDSFGETREFWTDVMEARVRAWPDGSPIAIEGARFPEEVTRFTGSFEFEHLHVTCSEDTRRARLEEAGELPFPDALTGQLARELDRVAKGQSPLELGLSQHLSPTLVDAVRRGESVVWSDDRGRIPDFAKYGPEGENGSACEPTFSKFRPEGRSSLGKVATRDKPRPEGKGADIGELVEDDIEARVEEGREKYGERLAAENGRDALIDAYQEALDLCLYLRQELEERGPEDQTKGTGKSTPDRT